MYINIITLQPLVALIAGLLILMMPRLLNIIVAIYLIVIGPRGCCRTCNGSCTVSRAANQGAGALIGDRPRGETVFDGAWKYPEGHSLIATSFRPA